MEIVDFPKEACVISGVDTTHLKKLRKQRTGGNNETTF